MVSKEGKQQADRVIKFPSTADHLILRLTSTEATERKLDFYISTLGISVKKLTITGSKRYCSDFKNAVADYVAKCSDLGTVSFQGIHDLEDEALEQLTKCVQLQHVEFVGCGKFTDAMAKHLSNCAQLESLKFDSCGNMQDLAVLYL